MIDRGKLESKLDAALARAKAARADGQRAENDALDLMIEIGTYSARKAEAERDAAVVRAEMAEAELAQLREDALFVLGRWHTDPATLGSTHLPGLDDDEAAALTAAAVRALSVGDRGFNVALRNVLSLAELPPVERD